jgi:hypothetical protein
MRRLNKTEWGILFIAGFFIVGGAFMAIHPSAMDIQVPHRGLVTVEHLSKEKAQILGAVLFICASGIALLVFSRRQ